MSSLKIHINFAADICTDKQWQFILQICRDLDIPWEEKRPGFKEASDWISEHYDEWIAARQDQSMLEMACELFGFDYDGW
jgi:hypothetical protein